MIHPLNSHPGNYNRENQLLLDYQAKQQPGQQPTAWSLCNSIRDILSVNQSFCGYLTTPTNLYYELVSSCIHDGVLKGAYFCPNHKKEQKLAYTPTNIFCLMLLALF
ncbi:hypothetical protein OIU76_016833 [Salix suchowensis]|nr:hypothetical protein OIU76_016833 [Salix suchowensis]